MCLTPFTKRTEEGNVTLSCGKCPQCKIKRVNHWVFRLMEEDKISSSSYFVTLTYKTGNLEITPNGFKTLSTKEIKTEFEDGKWRKKVIKEDDLTKFFKRLRKKGEKFKYYAAGEYGSQRKRPHYHIIIFNIRNTNNIIDAWSTYNRRTNTYHPIGNVDIGNVCSSSIAYTVKYIDKDKKVPTHKRDDRRREYSVMSNGLGKSFLTRQMRNYFTEDLSRNTVKIGKRVMTLPRYYRNKLFENDGSAIMEYQIKIREEYEKNQRKKEKNYYEREISKKISYEDYQEIVMQNKFRKFNRNKENSKRRHEKV